MGDQSVPSWGNDQDGFIDPNGFPHSISDGTRDQADQGAKAESRQVSSIVLPLAPGHKSKAGSCYPTQQEYTTD
jgi:hypothetical protein